jgi:hypothetical protein
VRPIKQHVDRPVLITEARRSGDDEFDHRRRRYLLMMGLRALCIIGAASTFQFSGWLAAAFVVGALVLPWTAVLIANDRPPKEAVRFRRFVEGSDHGHQQLAGGTTDVPGDRADSNDRTDRTRPPTVIDL